MSDHCWNMQPRYLFSPLILTSQSQKKNKTILITFWLGQLSRLQLHAKKLQINVELLDIWREELTLKYWERALKYWVDFQYWRHYRPAISHLKSRTSPLEWSEQLRQKYNIRLGVLAPLQVHNKDFLTIPKRWLSLIDP